MSWQQRPPAVTRGLLTLALILVSACYWPGLYGGWLFDDYPNIVDNKGVQPIDADWPALLNAALSSPASEFKRPLASLSFTANFLMSGLDPFWMKLTNLGLHLLNGVLVFLLSEALLPHAGISRRAGKDGECIHALNGTSPIPLLIATAWMLLPINLTAVLYVVQRMESLANVFVLTGLLAYVRGRRLMHEESSTRVFSRGFVICLIGIALPTVVGVLGKETAIMLPLYALLLEWCLFGFRTHRNIGNHQRTNGDRDPRITLLFVAVVAIPLLIGLGYLVPDLLKPKAWSTRDFTMETRLLSEARVVIDYIGWTIAPTPHALSFYHDDFNVSKSLWEPWTTLASIVGLTAIALVVVWLRHRRPLAALGIALFLGSHLLTATILPLELIYEHRNYFASFGLLLTVIPVLMNTESLRPSSAHADHPHAGPIGEHLPPLSRRSSIQLDIRLLPCMLALLMVWWTAQTAITAYAWGDPLRLAKELAARAPTSPRAQYELGRTYVIYSRYDPTSIFTRLASSTLETAAKLPKSTILPEQALIFMSSRMRAPIKNEWWDSMISKLKLRPPGVQDESSLGALEQCSREGQCNLPTDRMTEAFRAALSHPDPSGRLLAIYGNYAWNTLDAHVLGEHMIEEAVRARTDEPAYRITLIRMLVASGNDTEAARQLQELEKLNTGGRLNGDIQKLHLLLGPK